MCSGVSRTLSNKWRSVFVCHTLTDMNCSMFLRFSDTNAKSWSVFSCLLHGVRVLVRVLVSLTPSDKC